MKSGIKNKSSLKVGDIVRLKCHIRWWFERVDGKLALIVSKSRYSDYYYVYVDYKIYLFYLKTDFDCEIVC